MSTLNASPATPPNSRTLWARALGALGSAGAGALAVIVVLAFLPPQSDLVSDLLAPAIPSALALEADSRPVMSEMRRHRRNDAGTAQHGMYVRDPYGCLYMFQYIGARLTLVQVVDDHSQPVCAR